MIIRTKVKIAIKLLSIKRNTIVKMEVDSKAECLKSLIIRKGHSLQWLVKCLRMRYLLIKIKNYYQLNKNPQP